MHLHQYSPLGLLLASLSWVGCVHSQRAIALNASQPIVVVESINEDSVQATTRELVSSQCENTAVFTQVIPVVFIGNPLKVTQFEKNVLATSFRETYNMYTDSFCDPLFRTVKTARLEIFPEGKFPINGDPPAGTGPEVGGEEEDGGEDEYYDGGEDEYYDGGEDEYYDGDEDGGEYESDEDFIYNRRLQGLFSFNGQYTVTATQSNCDVVVPCEDTIFASSFGRRRLGGRPTRNVKGYSKKDRRNLFWLSVGKGKGKGGDDSNYQPTGETVKGNCICPAPAPPPTTMGKGKGGLAITVPGKPVPAEDPKQPEVDEFNEEWLTPATDALIKKGVLKSIVSQTVGEALVCRCAPFTANDPTFLLGDDDVYKIPSNQYPCRSEDESFFGNPKPPPRTGPVRVPIGKGKGMTGIGSAAAPKPEFLCPAKPVASKGKGYRY